MKRAVRQNLGENSTQVLNVLSPFLHLTHAVKQTMTANLKEIEGLFNHEIEAIGLISWGLVLVQERNRPLLRVYIDKKEGVTVADCTKVTRALNSLLDVHPQLSGTYTLEVSSPGVERELFKPWHYAAVVGQRVQVRLHSALSGQRKFSGKLLAADEEKLSLLVDEESLTLPLTLIDKAHVELIFEQPKKGVKQS